MPERSRNQRDPSQLARDVKNDIYAGRDPKDAPAYGIPEAARYLTIPTSTLHSWALGQAYKSSQGEPRFFEPVFQIADRDRKLLSFTNVCEAHVCEALRSAHGIHMRHIRRAIDVLNGLFPESKHPLVDHRLATSGKELFVKRLGSDDVINLSIQGQTVIRECLDLYLKRVDYHQDEVSRLFPFTRTGASQDASKIVMLDPSVLFGRPVIKDTRIATSVVFERWAAGESLEALADDYGRPVGDIEEALRCETDRAA